MKKKRLLLFPPVYSSLIRKEAEMFSTEYEVRVFDLRSTQKIFIPFRLLLQFFFLLKNISGTEIMVSRFVGYQTMLPILFSKITGKPVVCIMGGLECINFPSVKTGSYIRPFFGAITKWCLKNATHLCPVHDSLIYTPYTYQDDDYPFQGYKYFVPDCDTPATVIRNGYDSGKFKRSKEKIPGTFITVAHGIEQDHLSRLKGIDLILAIAASFPSCTFTIAGGQKELLQNKNTPNVNFIGEVPNENLYELLSTHEYYLKLSITEGFPNALCEAMLCECIPVGSNVGAIPEIIGNEKLVLKRKDPEQLKSLLTYALTLDKKSEAIKARNRIKDNYTLEKRRKMFMDLFTKLTSGRKDIK